jgi:hypothetical protein
MKTLLREMAKQAHIGRERQRLVKLAKARSLPPAPVPQDASSLGQALREADLQEMRRGGVPQGPWEELPQEEDGKVLRFLRKAGPGIGGALGAGAGALLGARRGRLLRGALMGLGTGATLGWVPGMAHGVSEGVRELR